ncbi:MAG: hypothetical protein VKK94_00195 [Cyanobacteriota bacterium]|nr:hypothetical protein [Cyanobacteriota bacterium]
MAITWLIEWRMRSSCSLSLVLGSGTGLASRVLEVLAGPDEIDAAAAVTDTDPSWCKAKNGSYAAFLG